MAAMSGTPAWACSQTQSQKELTKPSILETKCQSHTEQVFCSNHKEGFIQPDILNHIEKTKRREACLPEPLTSNCNGKL
jgi:hypothetical protein